MTLRDEAPVVDPHHPIDAGERMRARSGNQSALDTQPAFDIRLDDDGVPVTPERSAKPREPRVRGGCGAGT